MGQLVFCYCAYNAAEMVGDKELIRHSLESIKAHADRIIVIEGRFQENPHGGLTPNSTDRTVEIAREFTDEVYRYADRKQSFDHLNRIMDGTHRPTIIAKDFWLRHLNWNHPGQP